MDGQSELRVGIGGLGTVGRTVATRLCEGFPGYRLSAVSARRHGRAREFLSTIGAEETPIVGPDEVAGYADIVIEALPSHLFRTFVESGIDHQRTIVVLSAGQLLEHWDLVETATKTGGRIHVPSGALLGLDAVQAAAFGSISSVRMVTRKPVAALAGSTLAESMGIDLASIKGPKLLFRGTARQAVKEFPASLAVAVALSLAGIGPDLTQLEVWADPSLDRNTHQIDVESDSARLRLSIENVPSPENARTGTITGLSVLALLRKLESTLKVGT